jgi:hypothetical protein
MRVPDIAYNRDQNIYNAIDSLANTSPRVALSVLKGLK